MFSKTIKMGKLFQNLDLVIGKLQLVFVDQVTKNLRRLVILELNHELFCLLFFLHNHDL